MHTTYCILHTAYCIRHTTYCGCSINTTCICHYCFHAGNESRGSSINGVTHVQLQQRLRNMQESLFQPPTTAGEFDNAAAGGPGANSLNPVALFGFYAKWSLFRF